MSNQDSGVSNQDVCRKEPMCVLKEDYLGSLGGRGRPSKEKMFHYRQKVWHVQDICRLGV